MQFLIAESYFQIQVFSDSRICFIVKSTITRTTCTNLSLKSDVLDLNKQGISKNQL
jgi:hypothetical protein